AQTCLNVLTRPCIKQKKADVTKFSSTASRMSNFSTIRLLPEHLIDQIKAGEVVERPASLIKEILENSLDAGAKHLDLHIVDNGLSLISLEDDGVGMGYEDLPYAFARHATSK